MLNLLLDFWTLKNAQKGSHFKSGLETLPPPLFGLSPDFIKWTFPLLKAAGPRLDPLISGICLDVTRQGEAAVVRKTTVVRPGEAVKPPEYLSFNWVGDIPGLAVNGGKIQEENKAEQYGGHLNIEYREGLLLINITNYVWCRVTLLCLQNNRRKKTN